MKKIVLQYLDGSSPTAAEAAHKQNLEATGWNVRQRNGRKVGVDERVETADVKAVTGKVPAQYAAHHPDIEVIAFDAKAAEKKAAEATTASADSMTVAELKEALTKRGVEFAPNAKKSELIALLGSDVLA